MVVNAHWINLLEVDLSINYSYLGMNSDLESDGYKHLSSSDWPHLQVLNLSTSIII